MKSFLLAYVVLVVFYGGLLAVVSKADGSPKTPESIGARLDRIEARLDRLEANERIEARLDRIEARLNKGAK